jgi:hypothetical protein
MVATLAINKNSLKKALLGRTHLAILALASKGH